MNRLGFWLNYLLPSDMHTRACSTSLEPHFTSLFAAYSMASWHSVGYRSLYSLQEIFVRHHSDKINIYADNTVNVPCPKNGLEVWIWHMCCHMYDISWFVMVTKMTSDSEIWWFQKIKEENRSDSREYNFLKIGWK